MRLCVPVTAFVQNCRPCGSDGNRKGSATLVGRLRKAGMYSAFIYLSIYFLFFLFYFIIFLECLWSAKMLRIEGQLAFTKPHLFGQFIFHQDPVLDQTMTNLPQNTIGLNSLILIAFYIPNMTCLNCRNL